MGRGKRNAGGKALAGQTAALRPPPPSSASDEAVLLRDLKAQHELLSPLAVACARLARRRKLDCEEDLKLLDAARKMTPVDCFDHLLSVGLMLIALSDLFEVTGLEEDERDALEKSLYPSCHDALAYIGSFPEARPNLPWLSTRTEGLLLANLKRYAALVETPVHWQLEEALENMDLEHYEPYDFSQILHMLSSLREPRFADFQQRLTPLLTEAKRRVVEHVAPLRFEPIFVVDSHPDLRKAFKDSSYSMDDCLATARGKLILFSVETAEKALGHQDREEMDGTALHELVHLTQPPSEENQQEDRAARIENESRAANGRLALMEGATEALARRLLKLSEGGFAAGAGAQTRGSYDVEFSLVEALAAQCHDDEASREAMIKRLSATPVSGMLERLRLELDRPALSNEFLRVVGWFWDYRYSGKQISNLHYDSWLEDQAIVDMMVALSEGDYDVKEPLVKLSVPARVRPSALAV